MGLSQKRNAIAPERTEIRIITDVLNHFDEIGDGIRRVARADFSGLPENPNWKEVLCLGVMIDGYAVAKTLTNEHIQNFHAAKEAEFEKTGVWSGSVLEMWIVLFYYNRMNHWNEGYGFDDGDRNRKFAVSAYHALRAHLMNPAATAGIIFKTP